MINGLLLMIAAFVTEPIGELTQGEFIHMMARLGYSVGGTTSGLTQASHGEGDFYLQLSLVKTDARDEAFVARASACIAFDVPVAIPPSRVAEWLGKARLEPVEVASLLSGKVRFDVVVATPRSTPEQIKAEVRKLQQAARRFKTSYADRQPQVSSDPQGVGPATYAPQAEMMWPLRAQDIAYVAAHFGWDKVGEPVMLRFPGALVKVEGVIVSVVTMSDRFVDLVADVAPDPVKVERYLRNPQEIAWAEARIERTRAHFQLRHRPNGIVRATDLAEIIARFARNIRSLDIL